jgi:hypothetical protein
MQTMRNVFIVAATLALLWPAGAALAQETDTDVPQKLWFEIGGFRVASQTDLRLNGAVPGEDVDFERDLNVPNDTTEVYLEGYWRLGRRHQVSLNWTAVKRDGGGVTLGREIQWGDDVFRAGADVRATNDTSFLSGVSRFALYKNERFEVGPAVGLGYIWITATISGQAGVAGEEEEPVREVAAEAKTSSITGDIGGYFYWWPGRRFMARGDLRYIGVGLENADAEVLEGRASLTWYPWRQVGIGAQYSYTKLRYDRDRLIAGLGGTYQYDGLQILVSLAL